jgi:hypothetical protein
MSAFSFGDQVEDHRRLVDAHAGGRLVEHVEPGIERDQQRHLQLALVAVRQRGRAGRLIGSAGPVPEAMLGHSVSSIWLSAWRTGRSPGAPGLDDEPHIFAHGERWKQVGQLERPADPLVGSAPPPTAA